MSTPRSKATHLSRRQAAPFMRVGPSRGETGRKFLLGCFAALSFLASTAATFAQPAPVPALPDTERRTSYSISASTCACAVGFQLFGDSTDVTNWVEVFVNGVKMSQFGNWSITSPTGSIGNIARPITDGVLTFNNPQTGVVQIAGARRPRRTTQFNEGTGVPTRNLNLAFSDLTAQIRELWDKTNDATGRTIQAPPGETLNILAAAATRASTVLGFDALGNIALYSPATAVTSAASVTFLQRGTGAVARTVQSKIQETISAADYGMLCDGTTNDAPAMQAAINAADSLGGPTILLPAGTCRFNSTPFLDKFTTASLLTLPGLKVKGQGKDVTVIDNRVANGYALAINPDWKAAHQSIFGITSAATGSLTPGGTYYVQITMNDGLGNEIYVTQSKSIVLGGGDGRINITLQPVNTGYSYNLYCGTTSTPANYCSISGANASALGSGTVAITAIGTARAVPTNKIATWQNADISDLTITSTTNAAGASGVLYFKAGYANLTNVYMKNLLGSGLDIPNYTGDSDGGFVITVDKSKFDNIAGWCINAAGNTLELSNFTLTNTAFNLCGTATANLNTNIVVASVTNSTTPVITTATAHNFQARDQIYLASFGGISMTAGWYRVCGTVGSTTFNLCDTNGVLFDTTSLGAYTASSGTASLSWRPPTVSGGIVNGSGGIAWTGLIGTFKNLGITQVQNTAMYFSEAGLSDNATIENVDFENTAGKGLYIAALAGGTLNNSECLSTVGLGSTISCVQVGTGFNAGGVYNFKINNVKVRSNVTPAIGFEQFQNTNIPGTYPDQVKVSGIAWQLFDASGQTRFNSFKFAGIAGQAQFSISGTNTALLIPVGYGGTMPMKLKATGEWIEYHVPVGGITATTTATTINTKFYWYLYNSAAAGSPYVGALEFTLGGPVLDADGYQVKSGDSTRTFIGTATTDGSGNFTTGAANTSQYPAAAAVNVGSAVGGGITNGIFYNGGGNLANMTPCNSGAIITSAGGVPSCSTTLPNVAHGTPTSITLTNGTGLPTTGLTGVLQAAQEPAHTGDVTNSAGSLAMTVTKINGVDMTTSWTSYTPTVTPQGGSCTACSATGRYKQMGKTIWLEYDVTVTTVGSAVAGLGVSLPFTAASFNYNGSSSEINLTGKAGRSAIVSGGTTLDARDATGTTYFASGAHVIGGITYEVP